MEVIVYSTPTCPWCIKVKDYLKDKEVKFREVNVAEDRNGAMEMIQKSGQRGVPVIDVNGKVVIGFDQQALDNLLGQQS